MDPQAQPAPTFCALCPATDGVRPLAVYRIWLVNTRLKDHATRYALCADCLEAAVEHNEVLPGAQAEIL